MAEVLLARFYDRDFRAPRRLYDEDRDGEERATLRAQIATDLNRLDALRDEGKATGHTYLAINLEMILYPRTRNAKKRIESLDEPHPVVQALLAARSFFRCWESLSLAQRRDVVKSLVVPVVDPVPSNERGQHGLNLSRLTFRWL